MIWYTLENNNVLNWCFVVRCIHVHALVYMFWTKMKERETEDESDEAGRCLSLKATDMSAWPISHNLSNLPQVEWLKFSQTDVNAPHPSTYPKRTQCPTKELPSLGPDQGQPCHPLAPWARATHNLEEDGKREREKGKENADREKDRQVNWRRKRVDEKWKGDREWRWWRDKAEENGNMSIRRKRVSQMEMGWVMMDVV